MISFSGTNRSPRVLGAICTGVAFLLSACSSNQPPAPAAMGTGRPPAGVQKAPGESDAAAPTPVASRSVFSLDKNVTDPFFPKSKKAVAEATAATEPAAPMDIPSLLQDGFQGVLGAGELRIAIINNVMLEAGRPAVIPIGAAGNSRNIPVRCREVHRDAVILEVQGFPEPVKVSRPARL